MSNPWCYSCANGIQHILCDIRALGAYRATASKIVPYNAGVWSNIPKIDRMPTILQEKQAVKALEKYRRRLVYCAENSLALVGQSS